MKYDNIAGAKSLNEFVKTKINALESKPLTFDNLYEFMFSEKENIMWESNDGIHINRVTYGQCQAQIEKLAVSVKNNPYFKKDSVIGIYMDNSLYWLQIFWAILKAGGNPLLLNLHHPQQAEENIMKKMNASFVIADKNFKPFEIPTVYIDSLVTAETDNLSPSENTDFGNEIYLLSSGTSENIKICAYSAEEFFYQIKNSYNIITECRQIKKHYNGQLKLLTFLPFYHIFGLSAVYIWFAFFSRTFVYLKDLNPDTILDTIKRHEVTHIFAVPIFWETVYKSALREINKKGISVQKKFNKGLNLSEKIGNIPLLGELFIKKAFAEVRENLFGESIQFLISGGSTIKPDVLKFFNGIGYHFANGYGMTEIGITSVELSSNIKMLNSGSVGKPVNSIQYKISQNNELLVKGKGVAKYIIEGDKKISFKDNWFNTKDICICKKNHWYITGRTDELVVSGTGENLNPFIVESLLIGEGINDICLINDGLPVLLVSVNKFISQEKFDRISEAIKEKLIKHNLSTQIKKIFYTTDSFINENDIKFNRKRILAEYKNGTLTEAKPFKAKVSAQNQNSTAAENSENMSAIEKKVTEYFSAILDKNINGTDINADFFTDLGGTSLDYFAMISQIQNDFAISFPSDKIESYNTVSTIAAFIEENL